MTLTASSPAQSAHGPAIQGTISLPDLTNVFRFTAEFPAALAADPPANVALHLTGSGGYETLQVVGGFVTVNYAAAGFNAALSLIMETAAGQRVSLSGDQLTASGCHDETMCTY